MQVLVISSVWVEPNSSAAGSRMLQLLQLFKAQQWDICYVSTAAPSVHSIDLATIGIATKQVALNASSFDDFIKELQPNLVLFDRFMVEEQFGWRVATYCPNAIRILDSEDLHSLRRARQDAFKKGIAFETEQLLTDTALREIASIYRCDLTLIISEYEMKLLTQHFQVPDYLLYYLPFLLDKLDTVFPIYTTRTGFVTIGNFLHPPNWDAVRYLKTEIWSLIRKELPEATLSIYGAYPSDKVFQLHDESSGFLVKGRVPDAMEVLQQAKILLAPIRFGAGLKGKLIDGIQAGTPSVTTPIGAEGIAGTLPWAGTIVTEPTPIAFAKAAIALYKDVQQWEHAQQAGRTIVNTRFQKQEFAARLINRIKKIQSNLVQHRQRNFTGTMLQHHTMQSTKYMSRWIEEKNKG